MKQNLVDKIKEERVRAQKSKNTGMLVATRMVLSEIPRLNKLAGETATDSEVVKIIRGLIKSEMLTLNYSGRGTSEYLEGLHTLLPETVSEEELRKFVATVDFTKLKNKMQVIGLAKAKYGDFDTDLLKKIIEEIA